MRFLSPGPVLRGAVFHGTLIALALALALPGSAQEWIEVRTVGGGSGDRVVHDVGDSFRVAADPAGLVAASAGQTITLTVPTSGIRRVRLDRDALGPLEIVVRGPVADPVPAPSPLEPTAVSAPPVPPQSLPSPASSAGIGVSRAAVSQPAGSLRPSSLATEPGLTVVGAPGRILTSLLSPFMPVPPLATLPAAAMPGGAPTSAGTIALPPRPLVLATPPARRMDEPSSTMITSPAPGRAVSAPDPASLPSPPSPGSSPAGAVQEGPDSRFSIAPAGPAVVELSAPRGSDRPPDTSLLAGVTTKPGELAIFSLATDLEQRGLWGDAIQQYRRLLNDYPATRLREPALLHIGHSYRERAVAMEAEAVRQFDLRRSGAANEAVDGAILDYAQAISAYRDLLATFPNSIERNPVQLRIAQSLHGLVRARFQKGGVPQDSPAVVVEYLRAFVGVEDTSLQPTARLGIAQYYRDLADARMMTRQDRADARRAYERAIAEYQMLVDSSPRSPSAEEALIDLARLHDRNLEMRRFDLAVNYYDLLLARFPASRHAEEARARSRWLKENYL